MNKVLIETWVKALREGKYKQGRGRYRQDDCYCVLGVLFDTIDEGSWKYTKHSGWTPDSFIITDLVRTTGLDQTFLFELARRNDEGLSFNQLADKIEEHVNQSERVE